MNKEEILKLRETMGTLPTQNPSLDTKFYTGVEGIKAELITATENPYKAMYVMATSCWGKKINKWNETSPEGRFLVIKAVLERQTLPLPLEAPQFTFAVEGLSRSSFDQLARSRIGFVFSARGVRDNNWKDVGIRIPNGIAKNVELQAEFISVALRVKEFYAELVETGKCNWQVARAILPLSIYYQFSFSANYMALFGFMNNRLKFCEQEDSCGASWAIREEIKKKFPLLGNYLRPGCDYSNKCQYYKTYGLSSMFGCLFKSCGRHPTDLQQGQEEYCEFNESCSDAKTIEEQLGFHIPRPNEYKVYESIEDLDDKDKERFYAK